ncbi:hypothetical protein [Sulfitobacter dubius]|uniref:hypothetical protein n=1 Tax=Sulfitobacter dubius TaxID=218673 RepID=UPI0022AEC18C|nr:hypothetical protein [Sulfitobacter dubius]MCZ4366617.1 hypothetical protein [Sulfitobacter dubius]
MSRRKPLVVAFKASIDGAVRGARELSKSITGVGESAAKAEEAQEQMGKGAKSAADEAKAAMRSLNVKTEEAADKQIAGIEKNRDALKRLRKDRKISADEYVRGMKAAEVKITRINDSIGRDARSTTKQIMDGYADLGRGIGRGVGAGATAAAGGGAAAAGLATTAGGEFMDRAMRIRRASIVSGEDIQTIQQVGYAFESVGLDIESAGDMLKDFNEKLGEGGQVGAGGVVDFIEKIAPKLGLVTKESVSDAEGIAAAVKKIFGDKQGIDALRLYVKYLDDANLSQKEYTSYLEAMVSDSTALLPLLRGGADELDRLMANAENSGNLFDQKDLDDAEKLREATAQLRLEWQGLWLDFAGGGLTSGANFLTENLENIRLGLHAIQYSFGQKDSMYHPLLLEKAAKTGAVSSAASAPVNITIDGQTYSDIGNNPDAAKALQNHMNQKASVRPTSMPRTFR